MARGLDLDAVGSGDFARELRVQLEALLRDATVRVGLDGKGWPVSKVDTSAGWTNALLNAIASWAKAEGWRYRGAAVQPVAQPAYYLLDKRTRRNHHPPEYLWDMVLFSQDGENDEQATWDEWVHDEKRLRYRGLLVGVESEWGGALSRGVEDALELLVEDFYKLLDCPAPLRLFIFWLPTEDDAGLVRSVLEALHEDHWDEQPVYCWGFKDVEWNQLFEEEGRPELWVIGGEQP